MQREIAIQYIYRERDMYRERERERDICREKERDIQRETYIERELESVWFLCLVSSREPATPLNLSSVSEGTL